MYRSRDLRAAQYFTAPDWTGGIYASPTMAGSRPGSLSAGAWAALVSLGDQGFRAAARDIMDAAQEIEDGISKIAGISLFGARDLSVVSFAATPKGGKGGKTLNIFNVQDAMTKRGYNLNALQNPSPLHVCVTYANAKSASSFVADLQDAVKEVQDHPERFKDGSAALYGMAESIPDKSMVGDLSKVYIDCLFDLE